MEQINELNQEELIELVNQLKKENNQLKQSKKYGLIWEDSKEELDVKPVIPMLKKEESMNVGNIDEEPYNYLIEGDNYHTLKVLQHTHKNKIDIIYIDPPYNTGNEFVYNDKIVDKEDNFRHSKWLSFMDKRLRLARNLMSDNGVIFISIDDNEQAQLKLLMDSIFGEKNHITTMIWKQKSGGSNGSKGIITETEYIHVYSYLNGVEFNKKEVDKSLYKLKDEYYNERGGYKLKQLDFSSIRYSKTFDYPIYSEEYQEYAYPGGIEGGDGKSSWRWKRDKVEWGIKNGYIIFKRNKQGILRVYTKQYYKVDNEGNKITRGNPFRNFIDFVNTAKGRTDIKNIFEGDVPFSYPKPVELIKHLIRTAPTQENAAVLDFFAGSGTTGHAVMELNKEDGGNRSFILCTNNEVSDEKIRKYFLDKGLLNKDTKPHFNKFKRENPELITEFYQSEECKKLGISRSITRERIKRVSEGYTKPNGTIVGGLGGNLLYYVTEEFKVEEVNGYKRNELAELAFNSHVLKYPNNEYQNILVSTFTNLNELSYDNGKQKTFLINAKDYLTLKQIKDKIITKFGSNTIIHSIEDYYGETY